MATLTIESGAVARVTLNRPEGKEGVQSFLQKRKSNWFI